MKRKKYKYIVSVCVLLYMYYFFGVGDYIYSKSFDQFDYPLHMDLRPIIEDFISGKKPTVTPINYYPYRYLTNSGKCTSLERLDLFIIVKSAISHFAYRQAIRKTYGQENYMPGRIIKTLFFLGIESPDTELQKGVDNEIIKFKDIIQMDFKDTYYNNTIKTMMSFRWVYEHCSTADFYLFTDDDMYISVSNLLDYVQENTEPNVLPSMQERDGHMFAGYMFKSAPQRFHTSKWRVSLEEYPWDRWPPYITAGAYVVSNKSMKVLYVASLFVKHFRFDDIYLGIVAKKAGVELVHCPNFYFYKKRYTPDGYKDVIASHGYSNHEELIRVWNEQNVLQKMDSYKFKT